jgi:hypothetical protein
MSSSDVSNVESEKMIVVDGFEIEKKKYVFVEGGPVFRNELELESVWDEGYVEVLGCGREVELTVKVKDWRVGNDGIGAYEFWGHRGFDAGSDYAEVWDIDVTAESEDDALGKAVAEAYKEAWKNGDVDVVVLSVPSKEDYE